MTDLAGRLSLRTYASVLLTANVGFYCHPFIPNR